MRTLRVLGASEALTEHLLRHPEQWQELTDPLLGSTRPAAYALRAGMLEAVGASRQRSRPRCHAVPDLVAVNALRVEYRRVLLRLAARDLAHHVGLDNVAAELSDLAAGALEAALAIARARVGEDAASTRLVGDRDGQVWWTRAELRLGRRRDLRLRTRRGCRSVTSAEGGDPTRDPPDPGLLGQHGRGDPVAGGCGSPTRGQGRTAGADRAEPPELLRAVGQDLGVPGPPQGSARCRRPRRSGGSTSTALAPLVWSAAERADFVEDVQAMRRRVLDHIPTDDAERQLKLGSGGLRDVEFAVQLLQLVHGRADESVRGARDLERLGRTDAAVVTSVAATARRFTGPTSSCARLSIASSSTDSSGPTSYPRTRRTYVGSAARWGTSRIRSPNWPRSGSTIDVRYVDFTRSCSTDRCWPRWRGFRRTTCGLTPDAAKARMAALGYQDPAAALRHLEALTGGVSRTAAIQRALLPAMLSWCADAPDPDAGLLGFRQLSDAMGNTAWYLRLLRDEGEVAQRLAIVLSSSRYASDLLQREPQGVKMLGESLQPLSSGAVLSEMLASVSRESDAVARDPQGAGDPAT